MNIKKQILIGVALLAATVSYAQTIPQIPLGVNIGQPFQLNGQTFTVTTNAAGQYVIVTSGPAGSATNIPPSNLQDLINRAEAMVNANNPANAGYYGTNEIEFQVGAIYAQDTGQAYAKLGVEKWGLIKAQPNIGVGGNLLEGNANGQHATAGAYGTFDYRKIIGDVAAKIGAGGGYDFINSQPMGVLDGQIQYRFTPHLGSYVGAGYGLEFGSHAKTAAKAGGLMIGGGLGYAF